jgi:hypothetical protein
MKKDELITKIHDEMLAAVHENAASEIAALKQAMEKLEESRNLQSSYNEQAERLKKEIEAPRPPGLDVKVIKDHLDGKIKLRHELMAVEEAVKEMEEGFTPDFENEISSAKKQLFATVDPTVRRIAKGWQERLDELTREIDLITECWEEAFLRLTGNVDLRGLPSIPGGYNLVEINMSFLVTPQQRAWRKKNMADMLGK